MNELCQRRGSPHSEIAGQLQTLGAYGRSRVTSAADQVAMNVALFFANQIMSANGMIQGKWSVSTVEGSWEQDVRARNNYERSSGAMACYLWVGSE